jgi:serine/threonine protein kinase
MFAGARHAVLLHRKLMDSSKTKICPECGRTYPADMSNCPDDNSMLVFDSMKRTDPLIGREIDSRFVIRALIGEGGWGSVYRAWQKSMDREIALKILKTELGRDVKIVGRFLREAKASSKLKHPNTITVYDFGQTQDGILYLAMEFLEGATLAHVLSNQPVIPLKRAVNIISQVCDSLTEAHAHGIIHRDLKPENIFLVKGFGREDFVKVLDFGIAKLTETKGSSTLTATGTIFGTPIYMSPEQAMGGEVNFTTDIYALAICFYEMLSGRPPFTGPTLMTILNKHVNENPPPMIEFTEQFPLLKPLEQIIDMALDKNPEKRPQSAGQFKEMILSAVEKSQIDAVSVIRKEIISLEKIETAPDAIRAQPVEKTEMMSPVLSSETEEDRHPQQTFIPDLSRDFLEQAFYRKKKFLLFFSGIGIVLFAGAVLTIFFQNSDIDTKGMDAEKMQNLPGKAEINAMIPVSEKDAYEMNIPDATAGMKEDAVRISADTTEPETASQISTGKTKIPEMEKKSLAKKTMKMETEKKGEQESKPKEHEKKKKIEDEFKNIDTGSEFKNL